jgi:hypothetical protein
LVHGSELAFPLGAFLGQYVAQMGLAVLEAAISFRPEALGSAPIRF